MDPDPADANKTFEMSAKERAELDSLDCGTEKEKQKYGRKHTRRFCSFMPYTCVDFGVHPVWALSMPFGTVGLYLA